MRASWREALDYVGVFALELFCRDGELLANEMAPRVHNSGHWTIEGSETSQFENHLRAVLGLPLGDTRMVGHGLHAQLDRRDAGSPAPVLAEPGGHWHDYGKSPRAGRKVGHATVRADSAQALATSLQRIGEGAGPTGAGRAGDRGPAQLVALADVRTKRKRPGFPGRLLCIEHRPQRSAEGGCCSRRQVRRARNPS